MTLKRAPTVSNRTSLPKFFSVVQSMDNEKRKMIEDIGFGGLVEIRCRSLRKELCTWLVEHFNPNRCQLEWGETIILPIREEDVEVTLGIPRGEDVIVETKGSSGVSLASLEKELKEIEAGEEFVIKFILFACATLLTPGSHNEVPAIGHCLKDVSRIHTYNWSKFVLTYMVRSVRNHQKSRSTYCNGCFLFLMMFYFDRVVVGEELVERIVPRISGWTEEKIKERMRREEGGFGRGTVRPLTHDLDNAAIAGILLSAEVLDAIGRNASPAVVESYTTAITKLCSFAMKMLHSAKNGAEPQQAKRSDTEPQQAKRSDTVPQQAKRSDTETQQAKRIDTEPQQAKRSDTEPQQAKRSDTEPQLAKRSEVGDKEMEEVIKSESLLS